MGITKLTAGEKWELNPSTMRLSSPSSSSGPNHHALSHRGLSPSSQVHLQDPQLMSRRRPQSSSAGPSRHSERAEFLPQEDLRDPASAQRKTTRDRKSIMRSCQFHYAILVLIAALPFYVACRYLPPTLSEALGGGRWALPVEGATPTWLKPPLSWIFAQPPPTVTLRQGKLTGRLVSTSSPWSAEAFLGVPYALPPTGDRRFRAPVPVASGKGNIRATSYGPRCPAHPLKVGGWSEDCLTANIFRPLRTAKDARLPVAVYIHGGSFNFGAGKSHDSASMMAWSAKPFIAVNFNYRLGALGFLPSAVTAKADALNLGLRDQILLLHWIRENIAEFGGNPDDVTIFGLSAGAHSVGHHIMNYDTKGPKLFHRAILESGAATARAVYPHDKPLHETQFDEFISEVGCDSSEKEDDIMACLRREPIDTLIQASAKVFFFYEKANRWAFQPTIDGKIIKKAPIRAWQSGQWNKVPILTGFNTNDGAPFVKANTDKSLEFRKFFSTLIPALTDGDLTKLEDLYPDPLKHPNSPYRETRRMKSIGSQFKRTQAAYGHFAYICPVRQTARLASEGQDPPVYLYHWAVNVTAKEGASHGEHGPYEVYAPKVRKSSKLQETISGYMHAYFTSFITTGDPNTVDGKYANRPHWETYEKSAPKLMLFGDGNDERAGGDRLGIAAELRNDTWSSKECQFWSERTILCES